MQKPIDTILPGDLPEDWELDQDITPIGTDAGLTEQHGYNYQSKQINEAHKAINKLNDAFENAQENLENITTDTAIVDADTIPIVKSDKTKKRITFLTIVNAIKAKFNSVYAAIVHTHGNITNTGAIGSIADKAVMTGANGVLKVDTLPVVAGGTGKTSFTAGQVLVGDGTNAVTQRAIDNTTGGTAGSTALITSGAVRAAIPPTISISGAATGTATPFNGNAMSLPVTSLDATKLVGIVPVANGGTGVNDLLITKLKRGVSADTLVQVYLSPSGNDSANGLTSSTPMKTIRAAVGKYGGLNRLQLILANGTYTDTSTTALVISGSQHITISGNAASGVIIAHPIIFQSCDAYLYRVTFDLSSATFTEPGVTLRQAKYNIQECVFKGKTAVHAGINVSIGSSGYVAGNSFLTGKTGAEVGSGSSMTALNNTLASVLEIGFDVNGAMLISGNNTNSAATQFTMYNSAAIFNNGILLNQAANVVATAEVI